MLRINLLIASLLVIGCAPDAERARAVEPSGPAVAAVKGLMDAFNDHDPDRMREYWHDDVAWIELAGDNANTVTSSADSLHQELVSYFQSFPEVSSSLENITVNGNYLTAVERPVWTQDGEVKSQASVVVYEVIDGRVKRFWYYPPQ